jgi:uncharacterized DUF497 family protein
MARETRFEWNPEKAKENLRKHRIGFEVASLVFADPHIQTEIDGSEHGEVRYWSIGEVLGRVIMVVHTVREEDDVEIIRIISARKATRSERRHFEENS